MIETGTLLRVQTTTREDVFGEVLYEVTEVGLPAPEKERRAQGIKDGVKCVMLGGTGPAARPGYVVIDSVEHIKRDMATGVTEVVPESKKAEIMAFYGDKAKDGTPRKVGTTGVLEVD